MTKSKAERVEVEILDRDQAIAPQASGTKSDGPISLMKD